MSLQEQFEQASVAVKGLTKKPSNEDLLKLYSLFKQATEGDINIPKPGMFDMINRAKYDAWKSLEGKSSDEMKEAYVALVNRLLGA